MTSDFFVARGRIKTRVRVIVLLVCLQFLFNECVLYHWSYIRIHTIENLDLHEFE